uniref:Zinc finger protein 692 n=1 Tax=Latimeria chalumnae TaxID=7897 RepID=H3A4U4_LATCH
VGKPPRQREPEAIRRQKRKELDARRSKCRIRIGNHLEQWCIIKEKLGFSLHSDFAKFLLDSYSSKVCLTCEAPTHASGDALRQLVVWAHDHSQECGFIPNLKCVLTGRKEDSRTVVWECLTGHAFSWCTLPLADEGAANEAQAEVSSSPPHLSCPAVVAEASLPDPPPPRGPKRRGRKRKVVSPEPEALSQEPGDVSGMASAAKDVGQPEVEKSCAWQVANPSPTPSSQSCMREPSRADGQEEDGQARPSPLSLHSSPLLLPPLVPLHSSPPYPSPLSLHSSPLTSHLSIPGASHSRVCVGGGSPMLSRRVKSEDEEIAQIGPKRIRKAAKKEILLCDFDGCGKIFSNRQYLNHHMKYQHVQQRTFACSYPTCGKSFNFKKHLKEHEKLHSDKRDYICEFCARAFRTSSNLIIHRRIHTGEKPLQCEICGFTCRQKASLNWHMKKHDAESTYQFSCDICGKKFEKRDNVTAHKSKSHLEPGASLPLGLPPEGLEPGAAPPTTPCEVPELVVTQNTPPEVPDSGITPSVLP